MLKNATAEALLQDARVAQAKGERLWATGDWQNAAGQGWLAVRDATAALVLAVTGAPPPAVGGLYEPEINRLSIAISKLSRARGGEWERMDARFAAAANLLHDQTYYGRVYHEDLDDLLREAWDYIRCAEQLAGLAAGVAADKPVAGGKGCCITRLRKRSCRMRGRRRRRRSGYWPPGIGGMRRKRAGWPPATPPRRWCWR